MNIVSIEKPKHHAKFQDLTGQTFGNLTVRDFHGIHRFPSGARQVVWSCECSCGGSSLVFTGNLKSGHTSSCGSCRAGVITGPGEMTFPDGTKCLFDPEDEELISRYSWYPNHQPRTTYIATSRGIRMHRLLMSFPKGKDVDHRNSVGTDNRRRNLRICTRSKNCRNSRSQRGSSSRFKGVTFDRAKGKWVARIKFDKKTIFLGYHPSQVSAAHAYDAAAKEHFGTYARLNFAG